MTSPRRAAAAAFSSWSVTPAIAETTTAIGLRRSRSSDTACRIAAASASDAPPNLWISRADLYGLAGGIGREGYPRAGGAGRRRAGVTVLARRSRRCPGPGTHESSARFSCSIASPAHPPDPLPQRGRGKSRKVSARFSCSIASPAHPPDPLPQRGRGNSRKVSAWFSCSIASPAHPPDPLPQRGRGNFSKGFPETGRPGRRDSLVGPLYPASTGRFNTPQHFRQFSQHLGVREPHHREAQPFEASLPLDVALRLLIVNLAVYFDDQSRTMTIEIDDPAFDYVLPSKVPAAELVRRGLLAKGISSAGVGCCRSRAASSRSSQVLRRRRPRPICLAHPPPELERTTF